MLTKEQAAAAVKKHGSQRAAAQANNVPRTTFRHWLEGHRERVRPMRGKSLADFRSAHDRSFIVPKKIKEGLKQLGTGWDYEVNFLKLAGLSTTDLANHRDAFADHIVLVERTKRIWCGTKDFAAKLRELAG